MHRVELKHIPVRPANPFTGWQHRVHSVVLALFAAALVLAGLRLWVPGAFFREARWPDGSLLLCAAATTLASLSRQLPAQNVVLGSVVIGLFAGAAETLGAIAAVPFGPFVYNPANIGQLLFYPLPWAVPVIWVVAILNARGVARLMLRGHRQRPNYGLGVIGVTVLLVVLLDLSFEPYAVVVKEYWTWKPTKVPSDWYTMPWVNCLSWAVTALLILLFVTPSLISKSPNKQPLSFHPLLVWEMLSLLFLTGTALRHLTAAAFLTAGQMVVVAALSVLGSRGAKTARYHKR